MAGLAAALGFPYSSQFVLSGHGCCDSSASSGAGTGLGGQPALHSVAAQAPHVCSCQLEQVLQQKMNTLPLGLLPSPGYSSQPNMMFGSTGREPATLYPPLVRQYDIKDMASAASINPAWFVAPRGGLDPHNFDRNAYLTACHRFGDRFPPIDLNSGARRKNATKETTSTLKAWLYEHRKNPYPTKGEKIMLAILTKMTLTQVSTWFANARRRLKKENKMTWSPRNRCGERKDSEGYSDDDLEDNEMEDEKLEVALKETDKTIARTTSVIRGPEDAVTVTSRLTELTHHRSTTDTSSPDHQEQGGDKVLGNPAHRPDRGLIWSASSLINTDQTRTPHGALQDSPVKSLRKWVDGCFDRTLQHDNTPSSSSSAPSPDTPPQTPPADIPERLTETVGLAMKKPASISSNCSSPPSSPKSLYANDRSTAERSGEPAEDMTTNREIDAALALTTLFSRN